MTFGRSLAIDSADSWRFLRTVCFSMCHFMTPTTALSFYDTYHFVAELLLFPVASTLLYTPVTGDCGIFSSKEISQMNLLHRWQPIMVTCLNSLSS
ncbi:unnamed protein product [Staurois parvus]|uniref:Uncharacterized protein n=1 Tax=Staurois parvus TaxID=386267 RepID=A0ABN9F9E6_9NEOB|nr:unnamed protein product [Staurois parvus]